MHYISYGYLVQTRSPTVRSRENLEKTL